MEINNKPLSLLTIDGGSSSLKFAVFHQGDPPQRVRAAKIDRIGLPGMVVATRRRNRPSGKSPNTSRYFRIGKDGKHG